MATLNALAWTVPFFRDAMPHTARSNARKRVGVWGHFHGGNQGDELVVSVVTRAIRARLPDAEIVAISNAPADTPRRHRVAALPKAPGDEREIQPPRVANPIARRLSLTTWCRRKIERLRREATLIVWA